MRFSRETIKQWSKLVEKPKPLTDDSMYFNVSGGSMLINMLPAWIKLYPRLVSLLKANREHIKQLAWEERSAARHECLAEILDGIYTKGESPPLISVTLHDSYSEYSYDRTKYRLGLDWISSQEDLGKICTAFPTPTEALTIPVVKEQIEKDISVVAIRQNLIDLEMEIHQAIVDWQAKVRQDLFEIWDQGREDSPVDLEIMMTGHELGVSVLASGSNNPNNLPPAVVLPESTVEFLLLDGKTTHDIRKLPEDLQLLLRADVVFKSFKQSASGSYEHRRTYPRIVPCTPIGSYKYRSDWPRYLWELGGQWDPKIVTRDHEASMVAHVLLKWIGRPNATFVEMATMGVTFQCARCYQDNPNTWEALVSLTWIILAIVP